VPDTTVPVVVTHSEQTSGGDPPNTRLKFDGVLPLCALVDDIGVSTFNGSIVLPSGSYAFSTSLPTGGYASDASKPKPLGTHVQPVAPRISERIASSFGITWAAGVSVFFDPQPASDFGLFFRWVDASGNVIDAVGIADLTGVCLVAEFTLDISGGYASVNGRPISGTGQFTTTISPQKPGEGVWPTAVITKLSE
jgi:hypothetical protein